nr:hypothetical protein [Pseudomonas mohnii]
MRKQRDYPSLYERIKAYGTWCHALESSWIIVTDQTSVQVRDNLQTALDWDDGLLVTRLQGEGAWVGLSDEITQWLKNQAPHCTV